MAKTIQTCRRCGVSREARPNAVLCGDCKWVLSPAEYALWKPEVRVAA